MKTLKEYHEEIKKNAIDHWRKEGHSAFKDMENDPVINLLLSALSYQAFHIQKNIEQYEENTLRNFRDRIIPYHLIKPAPAFSIVETNIQEKSENKEWIADEICVFEFKKTRFVPLLETKIIQAELKNVNRQGKSVWIELQSKNRELPVENLSGLSLYIDTPETIDIVAIKYSDKELPLIKPSQYNELPFTRWFNNAHLFLNGNYHLFGTYDYWQDLFLTNTTHLFYIGQYDTNEIPLNGQTDIPLEIIFDSFVDINDIKINCIPVVNVEKRETELNDRNPVQNLSSDSRGEFLNLLYNEDVEKNRDEFFVRQHEVERYNSKQLLELMQEMVYRYGSDYYAFQSIGELRNGDKLRKMQEVVDEISDIVNKFEKDHTKGGYYAALKKNNTENKKVYLDYLITSGVSANGIKKGTTATKISSSACLNKDKTVLLLDTKGGKSSVRDEAQKEDIAKYYFQTKDRLVTPADIVIFIKTFYYNEDSKLGDDIENITIKHKGEYIAININLTNGSSLKNTDRVQSLAEILQTKIMLKSTGIMPFRVIIS